MSSRRKSKKPKSRRKQTKAIETIKENTLEYRGLLSKNIVITVVAGVLLFFMIPYLAKTIFTDLWIYAHDNIEIGTIDFEFIGGFKIEPGEDINFAEIIVGLVFSELAGSILLEFRWAIAYIHRVIRFTYLVILTSMVIFLAFFMIISLIMNNKVKFRIIIVSVIISAFVSFAIAFFWIPNDPLIFEYLSDIVNSFQSTEGDPFESIPIIVFEMIYAFWIGFAIMIFVNLILTTSLQFILMKREF